MDYITSQTPDKGVQIGPEPPISNDSIAMTPDKGVQIGKELPIINASIALTPDKGVQIGPELPIINASIALEPDKGVQIGPEPPISNDSIAMTIDTIPGFAGNLIESGIVLNGSKSAVYQSIAYPANADGKQRTGAVVEYSSEFSVGEGFSVGGVKSELPAGYLAADFLEATGSQRLKLGITQPGMAEYDLQFTSFTSDNQCMGFNYSYAKWGVLSNKQYRLGAKINTLPEYTGQRQNVKFAVFPSDNKITLQVNNGTIYEYERASIASFGEWCLWQATDDSTTNCKARIWKFSLKSLNEELLLSLLPSINVKGQVCFYDTVQKKDIVYTALYVGLTPSQARQLGKLPAGGGTLKVSLPEGYDSNAGVMAALETARSKGWTLTIQTYTPETIPNTASTFALRRIWVRKTQDEQGGYVDADEKRWHIDWCVDMITPDGSTPDAYGYEMFRSIDAAVAYWELTPYVDPKQEEEFSQEL